MHYAAMPSSLSETGNISPADAAFVDSPAGRRRTAESILRAVEVRFARRMASNGLGAAAR
jgi:N-acetylmuramoyl-L-alanine amidase